MEIQIHLSGRRLDTDFQSAVNEYIKRISPFCRVKLLLHKSLADICPKPGAYVINVNPNAPFIDSPGLASELNNICVSGFSKIEIFLSNTVSFEAADSSFALSRFCMDETLTCVCLTEQLYRAFTILNHITYHK
ncbi:MAG: 23S rRNA (pseudouridine(1915)-N(3))-methyltransferase RlmH [Clostridium sp.]|nr:23S rRNA (pseudouridine(1915)-N(3))-methyltransferase RlmH [Clostridium sp.]MCM1398208.1 23S rRNA (pseudouridine(1915)-N(3))-methyltransferase RlmH [Clostridium sp.]MCM1460378.1 23S rRNA (pseudouridine(1915)-N(3))-methyltransferase RlmH [Bacteroides sp.]